MNECQEKFEFLIQVERNNDMEGEKREPIPEPPPYNSIIDPPVGFRDIKTYNGFKPDENSSAFQKAVRRSENREACLRALEALKTNHECSINLAKRMLVIASEDIGCANPSLILMVDDLIGPDKDELDIPSLVLAADLLASSPKSRILDWAIHSFPQEFIVQRSEDDLTALQMSLINLDEFLSEKNFEASAEEACRIAALGRNSKTSLQKVEWKKLLALFNNPSLAKHYKKLGSSFWLPVLNRAERCGSQKVCDLVHRLYNIGCSRSLPKALSMRNDDSCLLFWMHAIWSLCNVGQVEETWYKEGLARLNPDVMMLSAEDRDKLTEDHQNRVGLLGIPDCALDKHTEAGASKGRTLSHFILHGAKLRGTLPSLREEEYRWLRRMVEASKKCHKLVMTFKIPDDYLQ